MDRNDIADRLEKSIDMFASIEHERWSHWQRFVHEKASRQSDGSLLVPAALVQRWEKQIDTAFPDLSEVEKESDREQVRKYLPTVIDVLRRD